MKRLVVYDDSGYIYMQMTESKVPEGKINFLEIDEENYKDKIIKSVDVSVAPRILVTENIPKTDLEIAEERLKAVEDSNAELMAIVASLTPTS